MGSGVDHRYQYSQLPHRSVFLGSSLAIAADVETPVMWWVWGLGLVSHKNGMDQTISNMFIVSEVSKLTLVDITSAEPTEVIEGHQSISP